MPIKKCTKDGKPGFKFGDSGFCYIFTPNNPTSRLKARKKAEKQGRAIEANHRDDKKKKKKRKKPYK